MSLFEIVSQMLDEDEKYKSVLSGSKDPAQVDAAVRHFIRDLSQGFDKLLVNFKDDPSVLSSFLSAAGVKDNDK